MMSTVRQWQRRRRITWIGIATLLLMLVILDQAGLLLVPRHSDHAHYHQRIARVVYVLNGDTVDIDLPDPLQGRDQTRVRLLGIRAPRLAHSSADHEPGAMEAHDALRAMIEGRRVQLSVSGRTRTEQGHLLARIHLPGDPLSINAQLLGDGLAYFDDGWAHADLSEDAAAERAARTAGRGVWGANN